MKKSHQHSFIGDEAKETSQVSSFWKGKFTLYILGIVAKGR